VERRRRTAIIVERQDERARIAFARNECDRAAAGIRYATQCRLRELWDDGGASDLDGFQRRCLADWHLKH
jgi:hypothetical protein